MSVILSEYRRIWKRKPVLRAVYDDLFDRIADRCVQGHTLEIGGGIGNLNAKIDGMISSDIQFAPWLDLVADAQRLPFRDREISNVVMLDVLHHLEYPSLLFREASRVLKPHGRLIMVEPAITLGSTFFYRVLHHEPVQMKADPLSEGAPSENRDPYESNQAIPTLIATKYREEFHRKFPDLMIREVVWFSFIAYPFSGGFKSWSLLSKAMAKFFLRLEKYVEGAVGRFLAFRLLLVIEKRPG